MVVDVTKLVDFLKESIGKAQTECDDASYNMGVCDGKYQAYKDVLAKFEESALKEDDTKAQLDKDIIEKVKAGRLIEAIKLCRSVTGLGLKEAKDYVEAIRDKIPRDEIKLS